MHEGTPPADPRERLDPDLGLFTVLRDDGTVDPATDPGLPLGLVLRAYREIKRLRVLDARMTQAIGRSMERRRTAHRAA